MRVGVRQWSQTIVVFLTSRIPESQLDVLAINLHVGNIVLEDGWYVDLSTAREPAVSASERGKRGRIEARAREQEKRGVRDHDHERRKQVTRPHPLRSLGTIVVLATHRRRGHLRTMGSDRSVCQRKRDYRRERSKISPKLAETTKSARALTA